MKLMANSAEIRIWGRVAKDKRKWLFIYSRGVVKTRAARDLPQQQMNK